MIVPHLVALCSNLQLPDTAQEQPAEQATATTAPRVVEPQPLPVDQAAVIEHSWPGPVPANVDTAAAHGVFVAEDGIAFAGGVWRPAAGIQEEVRAAAAARGRVYAYIQLRGELRADVLQRLREHGVRTWAVFPHQAVQAEIPAAALPKLARMPEVRFVGMAPPELKLHPNLRAELERTPAGGRVSAWVSLMGDDRGPQTAPVVSELVAQEYQPEYRIATERAQSLADEAQSVVTNGALQRALQRAGVEVEYYRPNTRTFAVTATVEQLLLLARWDAVHFLDLRGGLRLFHDRSAAMIGQEAFRLSYPGKTAEVGLIDGGVELDHRDLNLFAVGLATSAFGGADPFRDVWGHGTHVAGPIAGQGVANPRFRGMAPAIGQSARQRLRVGVLFNDLGHPLGDVTELYAWMALDYTDGVSITKKAKLINCSWGMEPLAAPWTGTEQECIDLDHYTWDRKQLFVVAAGDGGAAGVSKPGVAKSALTVGAIRDAPLAVGDNTAGDIAPGSAMGPTGDGRLKPELVAPGQFVTSAQYDDVNGYVTAQGTSHAAPHVTGMLASLLQHHPGMFDDFNGQDFSNPMFLRACAMAAALKKSGSMTVGDVYGFGIADAHRMHASSPGQWEAVWTPLSTAQQGTPARYMDVTIPSGASRWTVVLTWDEPPLATPGGATPVMGHIDLWLDYYKDQPGSNTGDVVSNGNGNYQYLIIDNPPAGVHRVKFFPRDTDYDDDGDVDQLKFSVCQLIDLVDVRPRADLSLVAEDPYLKPGEAATVKAVVGVPGHVASAAVVEVLDVPPGLALTGTSRRRADDLNPIQYGAGVDHVTLGAVAAGAADAAVDFTFGGIQEGDYTVPIRVNNDNGPDPDGHSEILNQVITIDGTVPTGVTNLDSATHPEGTWVSNDQIQMHWTAAVDDRSGIGGYSTELQPAATAPDDRIELQGDVVSDALTVADGDYYYTIRSVDRSGNAASGYKTHGPMRVDTTEPLKPTAVDSSSHDPSVWTNNPLVDLQWLDAVDPPGTPGVASSGVDGYGIDVAADPETLPDETKDVEEGVQQYQIAIPDDGLWFVNLRTLDNAGNWDSHDASFGPVQLDRVLPPIATNLSSSTHPTDVWLTQRFVTMNWTEPADDRSGLDGYSWSYSQNAPALPDTTMDRGVGSSNSAQTGADGVLYFNLRSKDKAGNWSNQAASYGPMQIDTIPPNPPTQLNSTTHDPSQWSNQEEVTVTWNPAIDPIPPSGGVPSGICGYSVAVDQNSSGLPDATKDIGALSGLTFSPGEGQNYFRIRSVDNAGQWSVSYVTWGPAKIDLTPPPGVVNLNSTSHPAGVWRNNRAVTMQWARPQDNLSGVRGYSTTFDSFFADPPSVQDHGDVQSEVIIAENDGAFYYSIKSIDKALNWQSGYNWHGPILIDTVGPDRVPPIFSSSHTEGVWSNDPNVILDWEDARDASSGVVGYSYDFNQSPTGYPDCDADIMDSALSLITGEGTWYFRVRAEDGVGLCSGSDREFGPIRIDLTLPGSVSNFRSTSHTPNQWSTDNTVRMAWDAATDTGGSGLSGYNLTWTQTLSTPPNEENLGTVTSNTSAPLADGDWWVTIHSHDNADNWDDYFEKDGPFRIDATAPSTVLNLAVGSHVVGDWTSDPDFLVTWDPATDAASGLAGYSLLVDDQPGTEADASVEETATGTTLAAAADGDNYVHVRAVDVAGNGGLSGHIGPFKVDTTLPNAVTNLATTSHTVGNWSNDDTVDFTWTAAKDPATGSGLAGYSYLVAAAPALPEKDLELGKVISLTLPFPEGASHFSLRSVDNVGNWDDGFASIGQLMIDTVAPTTPLNVRSTTHSLGQWSNVSNIEFAWDAASDATSGIDGYSWLYNTQQDEPDTTVDGSDLSRAFNKTDGIYYFRLRGVDLAANGSPTVELGPFQIDTGLPSTVGNLRSTSHSTGVWSTDDTVDMVWNAATDNLSGVDGYSWSYTSSQGFPDTGKEIEESTSATFELPDGTWWINLRTGDHAGNWSSSADSAGRYFIDTQPPTPPGTLTSSLAPGVWHRSSGEVTFSWQASVDQSNLSGLDGYSYLYNAATDAPNDSLELQEFATSVTLNKVDGQFWFRIVAYDHAKNASTLAQIGPIQVDTELPGPVANLGSSSHALSTWSADTTVDLQWSTAVDAVSGIDGYSVSVSSSPRLPDTTKDMEEITSDVVTLPDGQWYINFRSVDVAGNWDDAAVSIGPFWIDTQGPTGPSGLNSASHPLNAWRNDATVDLSWNGASDAGSGLRGYGHSFTAESSTPPAEQTLNGVTALNNQALPDGAHYFNLRPVDQLLNWSTSSASYGPILIDTVPPSVPPNVQSTSHTPGVWSSNGTVVFTWGAASDNASGVGGYSWLFNTAQDDPDLGTEGNSTVLTKDFTRGDGEYWFRIRTVDVAGGGSARVMSGPYRIDATLPGLATNLTSTSHQIAVWSNDNTIDMTWTAATDNLSGIDGYSWSATANQGLPDTGKDIEEVTGATFTLADGTWWINLRSRDNAGNWDDAATSVGRYFIDTVVPSGASVQADAGRSYTIDNLVDLTLACNDDRSGMSKMRFSNDGATWSAWENFATTRSNWDLVPFGGNNTLKISHTIYAQFRDLAGNVTATVSDVIYWAQPVEPSAGTISYANPASVSFQLYGGYDNRSKSYALLGSMTGTSPGTPLVRTGGGTITIALTYDAFFQDIVNFINGPAYSRFLGTLDSEGKSNPAQRPTYNPSGSGFFGANMQGRTIYFAFAAGRVASATNYDFGYTSPPVSLQVVP